MADTKSTRRLVALDAFRGLTIAFMILVNTPGSWSHVYPPLLHAYFDHDWRHWFGCTPTDLVFPFFLFIVGVAMRFSFKKFDFQLSPALTRKILGRMLTIFFLGLLLNAYPFIRQDWDWSTLRIMGVLQRIGIAYGVAAFLCLKLDVQRRWLVSTATLLGYWAIMGLFGGPEPYGLENNLARKIDLILLGESHVWHGLGIPFDPEGLLSTIPAIITVVLGYQVGTLIQTGADHRITVRTMLKWGVIGVVAGWLWGWLFPLNKPLWTSSYVIYTAGWATLILGLFIYVIDIQENQKFVKPLVIFGTNSIFVFVASGLWVKSIIRFQMALDGEPVNAYTYLYRTVFVPLAGNLNGSLLFALFHVLMWWLILLWLYRRKIFIKI
jgi:predicted acyltransferase